MQKIIACMLVVAAPIVAAAQTSPVLPAAVLDSTKALPPATYWSTSLKAGLNLNESLLSDNWKAGGVSSVGLSALFNEKANYHRDRHTWDNEADFLYAGQYAKGQGYRKTNDRLWLDTKYGYDLTKHWGLFVSLNVLSQFAPGYDYTADTPDPKLVSSFFAPAYLTNAYGAEYHPSSRFKLRLSPFAPRLTVVRDMTRFQTLPTDQVYGVNPGHSTRWEVLAAQVLAELEQPLGPNATLKARYLLFGNYESFTPQKIDHRLDLTLTAKVNRLLSVNFQSTVLYDYDQDPGVQFSQGLGLGILLTRERPAK
ncbi:MAG: DUF3078 domain-containing protein [Janthinobacterium lividum]